jgi:hypothetical protein
MHIHILEHVVFFALYFFFAIIYLIFVLHMHCINFVFYFQFSLNEKMEKQKDQKYFCCYCLLSSVALCVLKVH